MSQVSTKEPLFHIVKREGVTFVRASLIRLVAILLALVVCAFVIMGMTGMNPLSVYAGIWSGAVGTARRTWVTLRDSFFCASALRCCPPSGCASGTSAPKVRCWWGPWPPPP